MGISYIFHMRDRQGTEEKILSYMEKYHMLSPGCRVVAGVSGGADSVCLLFVLLEYRKKIPFELAVVHVNHSLRTEAGEDAEFVRKLCCREGVPFFLKEADVKGLAAREKCSLEEAGRKLRYQAFEEAAESFGADRIAVAHNGNDRAETMLFHLFRGTGLKGLCGIPPCRQEVIRPLLCLERSEIEEYLAEREISYRTDNTNQDDDYTRNRIRHHILPYAEQEISAGAVEHMCRTAEQLSEVEDYLEQQTKEAADSCVEAEREGMRLLIRLEPFERLHAAMKKRLLLSLLRELAPGGRDISSVHVEEVLTLFEKEGSPQVNLPFGIRAVKRYDKVMLERECQAAGQWGTALPIKVMLPGRESAEPLCFDLGDSWQAEISVFFVKKGQKVPQNQYTKWLDCDKIMESPMFRFRETGDFLTLADREGGVIHKSLKTYMITEKIPREDRGKTLLLAEGNHVLWLIGHRISEYYKVNGNTKRILQVKLLGGCPGSGTEEKDGGTHQSTFV